MKNNSWIITLFCLHSQAVFIIGVRSNSKKPDWSLNGLVTPKKFTFWHLEQIVELNMEHIMQLIMELIIQHKVTGKMSNYKQ